MADYKDIIAGTIKSFAGKVKDVAESSTVRGIYEHGAERAKAYGSEYEELKRAYTEIGKLYFEQARENPEGFFAPLFAQVEEINARIREKESDIEALKTQVESGKAIDIDIEIGDFDDVVDSTEADGSGSGDNPEE